MPMSVCIRIYRNYTRVTRRKMQHFPHFFSPLAILILFLQYNFHFRYRCISENPSQPIGQFGVPRLSLVETPKNLSQFLQIILIFLQTVVFYIYFAPGHRKSSLLITHIFFRKIRKKHENYAFDTVTSTLFFWCRRNINFLCRRIGSLV